MLRLELDRVRMRAPSYSVGRAPVDLVVVVPDPRGRLQAVGALQLLLQGQVLRVEHLELPLDLKFTLLSTCRWRSV